ncbi:hypothetical protein DV495_001685 [Geotrichum candidum]|nr:hypothetical protein DV454_000304 [Geotrichum candidum]KAI9214295.1 hypothetical protein DS838_000815 [Geotrichum bryndzae]KAF5120153.1 hypothetical protein DV452_001263 [Geotrichum candidum]KAF5132086.1 hypothetical protein DV495_001685 [Geotrichum candidum]KAF7501604.1 hypothetical protein DV113_000335 [Geotrichum candidum]
MSSNKSIDEVDDASLFLRDQSPIEDATHKEIEIAKQASAKASEADEAVAAAAAAIQTSAEGDPDIILNHSPAEEEDEDEEAIVGEQSNDAWPIDQVVTQDEFDAFPENLRESLAEHSTQVNGLTQIPPLEARAFPTKKKALKYIDEFSANEGFSVHVDRENSDENKMVFFCGHSKVYEGNKRPRPEEEGEDEAVYGSCPFRITVSSSEAEMWAVDVQVGDHNHGPFDPGASHKRRRLTEFQKTLQIDTATPAKPAAKLQLFSDEAIPEDQKQRGKNILKGLVGALRFDNAIIEERIEDKDNITHLFWTTSACLDMLKQYPEVLFINFVPRTEHSIQGTFVHIVGITGLNKTFEVGYSIIKNAQIQDFRWVLTSLKNVVSKYFGSEYMPASVICYNEPYLLSPLGTIFPGTTQICVAQVIGDVYSKSLIAFDTVIERKRFLKRFKQVIDSETPEIFAHQQSDFLKRYAKCKIRDIIKYKYFDYRDRFVRGWVDQHRHFNNYSMAIAEPVQAQVEGFVKNCGGDLLRLYYQIIAMQRQQHDEYMKDLANQKSKCPVKFYVPFYDEVRFKISTPALEMIQEQHERYLELVALGETHRCTGIFTAVTGLPCKHTLSRPVTMEDIHPHWWLDRGESKKAEEEKAQLALESLTDRDRAALELNEKFNRALGLAKDHFLNFSSLEAREYMLTNMVKYFTKTGVPMDFVLNQTSAAASGSASPTAASRGDTPVPPVDHDKHANGSSVDPQTEETVSLMMALSPQVTSRRCGKCNQIGHNSRTCGQRMWLQNV